MFPRFLLRAFAVLRDEVPEIHGEIGRRLAGLSARLRTDGGGITLRFQSDGIQVIGDHDHATIDVQTDTATVLALADGTTTLEDCVLGDRLVLRGTPAALLRFHEGLMAFLHGAVRAPSFIQLLADFRAAHARDRSVWEGT